jgi:glutamyl-tRNA reductase
VRANELEHALKALARGDAPEKVLEALSRGITNKLLHPPTQALNQLDGNERNEAAALLSRIYHLHPSK